MLFCIAIGRRFRGEICPGRFENFRVVLTRFSCWARSGVWEKISQRLAVDADNEYALIDSTIVRAHQHSAGCRKGEDDDQALGRSRGGLSSKIHAS